MAGEQLGRTLLIQIGNGEDPGPETFSNLCGLKDRSFDLSTNSVDTTKPSCTNPGDVVQKTSRPGIASRVFTGSGTFVSSVAMKAFVGKAIAATTFNAKVIWPGLGTFTGEFFTSTFTGSGDMENDLQFNATFEPTGPLTFVAEV
jgi:predicted secreted protein